jgi:DNA-3-methyladenine glycosylase
MLPRKFFERQPLEVARSLIGCRLAWQGCSGEIVETEAYAETGDEAAHMFFRKSAREFIQRNQPGTAYVYLNYGVHWLFNVMTRAPDGEAGLILIRALRPTRGLPAMRERRGKQRPRDLCSGPGKLTQALGILGDQHETSVCRPGSPSILPRPAGYEEPPLLADARIGISKAQELPWRILAGGSPWVSVKPTQAAIRAE